MNGRFFHLTIVAFCFILASCQKEPDLPIQPPEIPEAPQYYVLDNPKILKPETIDALGSTLVEHDRLTGEQIMVGVFRTLGGQDLTEKTRQIFTKWRVGQRGKDNGILLAIFLREEKAKLYTGLGLASVISESVIQEILSRIHVRHQIGLAGPSLERSLPEATYRILRALNSPLLQGEKIPDTRIAGFLQAGQESHDPDEEEEEAILEHSWVLFLLLGVCLTTFIFFVLLSREAYFTAEGWYRLPPWKAIKTLRLNPLKTRKQNDKLGGTSGNW